MIDPTIYEPFDGDFIDDWAAGYEKLINDIQRQAGAAFGPYLEICVSLSDDKIHICFSNDEGNEWLDERFYDVPPDWTLEQLRAMFAGYAVYLKTDDYTPLTTAP